MFVLQNTNLKWSCRLRRGREEHNVNYSSLDILFFTSWILNPLNVFQFLEVLEFLMFQVIINVITLSEMLTEPTVHWSGLPIWQLVFLPSLAHFIHWIMMNFQVIQRSSSARNLKWNVNKRLTNENSTGTERNHNVILLVVETKKS